MTSSRLTYIVSHEAHYASVVDGQEINVSRQALNDVGGDDGVHWEFTIRWHVFDKGTARERSVPRVEMFDDSWQAFLEAPALFAELAARADADPGFHRTPPVSPPDIAAMLDELGFIDRTPR